MACPLTKLLRDGTLQRLADESRYPTAEALLVGIGYGRLTAPQVVERLQPQSPPKEPQPSVLGQLFRKVARRSTSGVMVQGIEDVLVRYGRCCNPLPGDGITGFITRGRGITVHVANCSRSLDADPQRRIDVSWDPKGTFSRPVAIRVLTSDRPGILALVSQAFTDHGVNISQANCKVTEADRAINTFEVMIRDAEQLRQVVDDIKAVAGVLGVDRT